MDDNEINIEGVDRARLIQELHAGTRALGMGALHDRGPLSIEVIRETLERCTDKARDEVRFDYLAGRPLKVSIKGNTLRGVRLYDRDAGQGAFARALERARKAA